MKTANYLQPGIMMAGAFIGGYLGSMIGMPSQGAAIGATAAGIIAGYLFRERDKKTKPPGLQENRIQISTYGTMLPMLWGTKRMAGNVIWMDEIKETYRSDRYSSTMHDGIGGGIGDSESKWYVRSRTYTCTFAIAFCEGPVSSIIRMWVNNELFVDFRDPDGDSYPPSGGDQVAQNNLDRSSVLANQRYTLYYGTESQTTDPTLEAIAGAGNVSGYRGICYVVFKDFPVGAYSNIPTIEAEVVKTGVIREVNASINPVAITGHQNFGTQSSHPWTLEGNYLLDSTMYHSTGGIDNGARFDSSILILKYFSSKVIDTIIPRMPEAKIVGTLREPPKCSAWSVHPITGKFYTCSSIQFSNNYASSHHRDVLRYDVYEYPGGELIQSEQKTIDSYSGWRIAGPKKIYFPGNKIIVLSGQWVYYWSWSYYWAIAVLDNDFDVQKDGYAYCRLYHPDDSYVSIGMSNTSSLSSDKNYLYMYNDSNLVYIPGSPAFKALIRINPAGILGRDDIGGGAVDWGVSYGNWEIVKTNPNTSICIPQEWSNGTAFDESVYATTMPVVTGDHYLRNFSDCSYATRAYQDKTNCPLSDCVEEICERAGVTDIDTTDLETDEVRGYLVTRQTPAKVVLEPLMSAFIFDAAEIDWALHFIKRGSSYVALIGTDDLGAKEDGEGQIESMVETRTMDAEIPTGVTINYESEARDYDIVSQHAVRVDRAHKFEMAVDTPLVMSDAQAKQQAEIILKALWISRIKYKFTTSRKFDYLAPCNVVRVGGKDMRITKITDRHGVLIFEADAEETGIYTSEAETDDISFLPPEINDGTVSTTRAALLDIPLIDSDDEAFGFYLAFYGYSSGFNGGGLYISRNSGLTFEEVDFYSGDTAIVGECRTDLEVGVENVFNASTVLNVTTDVTGGNFTSRTIPDIDGSTNLVAIGNSSDGWEIVQFKTMTNLGNGSFRLVGFWRGLYGTSISAHAEGDQIVPLIGNSNIRRIYQTEGFLGQSLLYAVSTYNGISNNIIGGSHSFTNNFYGAKPFPASDIRGARNTSGDLTISWKRGDRLFFTVDELHDTDDIPMSETTEAYEVDIINRFTNEVLRTIESTSPSVEYEAADQVTDGYPNEVVNDNCSGSFSTNFTEYSYAAGWATFANGMLSLNIGSAGTARGANALANQLVARSGVAIFSFDAYTDYRLSSSILNTSSAEICIVKSSPSYTTAANGYYRPEYGVGQNSFLMMSILNTVGYNTSLAKFVLTKRVNGTNAELGSYTCSSLSEFTWSTAGYRFDLICDFTNHTIILRLNDRVLIGPVDFGSAIDSYLGSDVQINFHHNNYSYLIPTYFDNVRIAIPATSAAGKIKCNIYQISSTVDRGRVATAIV